jgi:hypothetical protein
MRLVFFGLLLANLILLLVLQSTRTAGTEPERIAGQLHPERLTVIAAGSSQAHATSPAVVREVPPALPGCVELGDFSTRSARDIEAKLAQLSPDVLPKKRLVQAPPQHIVYLPPQASEAAAGRRLAQLRQMGFTDSAVIRDEPTRRWGLSLGLFSRLELAEARQQTLREAGVSDARITEYPVNSSRYAYRLSGLDDVTTERLKVLVSGLAGIALRECQ